jgi:ParB family chromosome partitioning protein
MSDLHKSCVQTIPINNINILNPRTRNKKKFEQIVSNISSLGLKKPITVCYRKKNNGNKKYDLVCGQGRLEAYKTLGQIEIPAIIISATPEECLLMSLVENLARRQYRTIELLHEVSSLKERGYNFSQIAHKTDLTSEYVRGVVRLLKKGEDRLLVAVEKGQIPISIAVDIAVSEDHEIQKSLHEAYETKKLRGHALIKVRRIIEQRRNKGKSCGNNNGRKNKKSLSSASLVRIYQQESARQKRMVQKAKLCEARLTFILSALKELYSDENFTTLLRAESINALPRYLANELKLE